jgi:hypothetical protein
METGSGESKTSAGAPILVEKYAINNNPGPTKQTAIGIGIYILLPKTHHRD